MTEVTAALTQLRPSVPATELETGRLEFKQEDRSVKRTLEIVADAVVCFANALGGTIILGVADRPGPGGSVIGISPGLTVDVLIRGIFDRTRPALSVPVEEITDAEARLLVVTVPRGATFYANAKGTATRRVGRECRPFPPEEQKQALASRGLYDWSAEPSGQPASAADPDELARLRRLLASAGRDELGRATPRRLLRDLRLTLESGELTRAGLLLVGREEAIREAIPSYGYAYQFRPSSGAEATARLRESRPMLAAMQRLLDAVGTRRSVHPLNLSGGVQLQLYDYPVSVVRELVVNALVHRDYEADGAVEVEHSPERLRVSSPGGLVFGVTPDNILTHPSTPRNRLLLESITSLQVAERTGQGVDRVYRELLRAGKPPPGFADDTSTVHVNVSGGTGNDAFARYVNGDLDESLGVDIEVLLALGQLRDHRSITASALAPGIQQSQREAQTTLDRMATAGLLAASRRTAGKSYPTYALSAAALTGLGRSVTYHRLDRNGTDLKVAEHVDEYGYITNQTLRRLFDLSVYPARDLLRDLQGRGVLTKIDEKSSGPGVRYGPGPQFPSRPTGCKRQRVDPASRRAGRHVDD